MAGTSNGARGQVALVLPASVASASLIAQHVTGKATRDALFLTHFGIGLLPAAMIATAVVSSLSMIGTSRALARLGPARLVPAVFGTSAVLHVVYALFASAHEPAVAVAVYLHSAVLGATLVSAFWSLVNESFDPQSAKRAVGRIAGGGTVGGVLGGLVVWRAAAHVPVEAMLALLAATNLVGLVGSLRLASVARERSSGPTTAPAATGAEGSTLGLLVRTPYLRDLALLVLVGALLQALLDWLMSARATQIYGKGAPLLGFFALFNMIVGLASFVAQTGLSRTLLERLGLAGTARLQPVVTGVFTVVALLVPGSASIFALRGAEAVSRNSFFRSAYELFYTPLPAAKKRATKALVDVGFDRIGTTLGSGALLLLATLPAESATRAVLASTLVAAGAATLVASRLHDGYVDALADSLKSGAVALGDDELVDLTTRRTLAETTALLDREKLLARIEEFQRERDGAARTSSASDVPRSAETDEDPGPRSRRAAALPALPASALAADPLLARAGNLRSGDAARVRTELATPLVPELAPFVIPLLATDAVARDAVRALRRLGTSVHGALVDRLLDPRSDVRVRRRIPRVLRATPSELAVSGLFLALRDGAFEVRQQAAVALAQATEGRAHARSLDREAVFDAVLHELDVGRSTWGAEPARGVGHVFVILGLVLDREPLAIALRALRGDDAALRGTAHEYLDVVLPPRVLAQLSPLLGLVERTARPRAHREIAEELLRSNARLPRPDVSGS